MNGTNNYSAQNGNIGTDEQAIKGNEYLPIRPTILAVFNLLLCSLLIPFTLSGNETLTYGLSLLTCLISTVVVFTLAKHIFFAILYTALLALFLGSVTLPLLPALIFCPVVAIGSCAALFCSGRGFLKLVFPLIIAGSFVIPLILFKDPMLALSAIIIYLPVFALGISSRNRASATGSVVACTVALVAFIALVIGFTVNDLYGTLSPAVLNQAIDDLIALTVEYAEQGLELFTELEVNEAMHNKLLSEMDSYVNLSFGAITAICSVFAYLAFKIEHSMLDVHGIDSYGDDNLKKITASVITAFLFVIALVLSFSLDPHNNTSIVAVVAENICIILFPALGLMTLEAIRYLPSRLGLLGLILSAAVILLIIVAVFFSFPMIIAVVGAVYVIAVKVDAWAKEHYSKGENQ